MATIRDVAKLAGVSSGTVSNVLNRPSYVNADTRERVSAAIRELDFVPRQGARQYRPGRVRTLGLAIANLGNPFFVDVALGAEELCKARGVGVVLCNSDYDPAREEQNLDLLVQQRVQGIIIAPVDENSSRIEMLKGRGVPMVFVDRVGDDRDCWSVVVDDVRGGQLGMQHLIDRGHRHIAFVGHPDKSVKVAARLKGASDIARNSKLGITLDVIEAESWTLEAGQNAGRAFSQQPPAGRPTAIFCANDMLALGVLQQLLLAGIKVPDHVAVLGYDDLEWAAASMVPLSSVSQPRAQLGRTAAEMLLELIERPLKAPTANHVVLHPKVVARATT